MFLGTCFVTAVFTEEQNEKLQSPPVSPYTAKTVILFDWWLVKAEKGKKLGVAGFTQMTNRSQDLRVFNSAPIMKRIDAYTLETEDNVTVMINSRINAAYAQDNGFSPEVCNKFFVGFPYNWEEGADICQAKDSAIINGISSGYDNTGTIANSVDPALPDFDNIMLSRVADFLKLNRISSFDVEACSLQEGDRQFVCPLKVTDWSRTSVCTRESHDCEGAGRLYGLTNANHPLEEGKYAELVKDTHKKSPSVDMRAQGGSVCRDTVLTGSGPSVAKCNKVLNSKTCTLNGEHKFQHENSPMSKRELKNMTHKEGPANNGNTEVKYFVHESDGKYGSASQRLLSDRSCPLVASTPKLKNSTNEGSRHTLDTNSSQKSDRMNSLFASIRVNLDLIYGDSPNHEEAQEVKQKRAGLDQIAGSL